MQKSEKLTLNQETLRKLTSRDSHRQGNPKISQVCNTKFLSCPECNPPAAQE